MDGSKDVSNSGGLSVASTYDAKLAESESWCRAFGLCKAEVLATDGSVPEPPASPAKEDAARSSAVSLVVVDGC